MRGLVVVTNNSTYLFDGESVMFVSHDGTTEKALGDGHYLISGQWYPVTRKPSEPEYDSLDFGNGGCNYKGITFGFSSWNQSPLLVTTSRVREWAYLGDGLAEGVFLSDEDRLTIAREVIAKNASVLDLTDGRIGRHITAIALVRGEFPRMTLSEARYLLLQIEPAIKVSTTVTFDVPLPLWERNLLDAHALGE